MEISPLTRKLVALALDEDDVHHDVTAALAVPPSHRSVARIVARERLVVCGLDIVGCIIEQSGFSLTAVELATEGAEASADAVLAEISGPTRELLAVERTILNFLQRLCGVATHTREFVEKADGLVVLDTRKTMPGWRALDKHATAVGGARNHRMSLGDMVLVKNNHIDANPGGIRAALEGVVAGKPENMAWEVEVRSLDELRVALEFRPTFVMLDNFSDVGIGEAMAVITACKSRPMIEASGGVRAERLSVLKGLGVDAVSSGFLTTHAPNVDISMRLSAA